MLSRVWYRLSGFSLDLTSFPPLQHIMIEGHPGEIVTTIIEEL